MDTGSNRVVLFGGNFSEAGWLTLRNTPHPGASLIDPKMHVQVFSAADIILGGQHFSDDLVYFVPKGSDPVFDGLLGVRAARVSGGLSFDQAKRNKFIWENRAYTRLDFSFENALAPPRLRSRVRVLERPAQMRFAYR